VIDWIDWQIRKFTEIQYMLARKHRNIDNCNINTEQNITSLKHIVRGRPNSKKMVQRVPLEM